VNQTDPCVTIFARWPEAGLCKTRLIPDLGAQGAAAVYRKLLRHSVEAALQSGLDVCLAVTGAAPARFEEWLDQELQAKRATYRAQAEGDLGAKLAAIPAPTLLIGSDCPGLDSDLLRQAATSLKTHDAVLGPALDGGYYMLGLSRPMPFLFSAMPWSTPQVLAETERRLKERGVSYAKLKPLSDIDTHSDLASYPEFLP
jgi:rSAM/selenodomain-associated transferase 1